MSGIVIQHGRGNALGWGKAGSHAVRRHYRHGDTVGDELLDRHSGLVNVSSAVGPIVHDVMIVGYFNVVEIDGAEFVSLRDQKIRVALPARAACIGWTALTLERCPIPRLVGRDYQVPVYFR